MNFIRESIFSSAMRAFSAAFLGIIGALVGLFVFITFVSVAFLPPKDTPPNRFQLINQPRADGKLSTNVTDPIILQIDIDGTIGTPSLNSDLFRSLLTQITEQIPAEQLKGILVYFNTPGGSATDSYTMYMDLKNFKQMMQVPVFGFVDGMCASGGVFISAACDQMYSTPPSILGSVGVRMGPFFNVNTLFKTYGVSALTLATKNKVHLDPFTEWTPEEQDFYKPVLDGLYAQFVDCVVDGRCPQNLTKEAYKQKLLDVGANIYMSKDAVDFGFTNVGDASRESALSALTKQANITDMNYRVLKAQFIAPFQLGGMQSLLQEGKIVHEIRLNNDAAAQIKNDKFLAIYP
jgi:protease-4